MQAFDTNQWALRLLDAEGVKTLVSWAAAEGWDPGLFDAEVFYHTDPEGFYGYFLGDEMIGGGSLVSYQGDFGFMGFFIVLPQYRAQGIGKEIWFARRNLLLSRLKSGAPIGMDGVVAMQDFYRKGGFKLAFKDIRYRRKAEAFPVAAQIRPLDSEDMQAVSSLDKECFGYPRDAFLHQWLSMPNAKALVYRDKQQLEGYAVLRKTVSGYKIGPLFASRYDVGEALYRACLTLAAGADVFLDVPESNPAAKMLVEEYKADAVFECARMYYGAAPVLPWHKVYGITSFELG